VNIQLHMGVNILNRQAVSLLVHSHQRIYLGLVWLQGEEFLACLLDPVCPLLRMGDSSLRTRSRLVGMEVLVLLLVSCGQGVQTTPTMPQVQGAVHGGQQPVVGANIALFAAGSSGYGSANTSILSSTVTSNSNGNFSITGLYTCPSASAQMYLVATGGNSGAGTNSSLALMAALGSCSNLSSSTFVDINEVTTVAAAYALAPFMATNSGTPGASIGASSTNSQGLSQAFTTASNLVNVASGKPGGASLPSSATVPSTELYTLADILATCVNSNGISGECSALFADATPSGGTAPQNTIDAIFDIAQNPSNNVTALYNLVTGTPPFQPTLGAAPNDWTVAINYTDATLSAPQALVVDSSGNIWVGNTGGNSLTKFSNGGTVLSGTLGYTGGGLSTPRWATIDTGGNIWLSNANNSVSKFSSGGVAISGSSGITNAAINAPQGIAAYSNGVRVFASNSGASSVSAFSGSSYLTSYTLGGLSNPYGMVIAGTNFWATNGNNSLTRTVVNGSAPANFTGGGLNSPRGIAFDHSTNAWVANHGNASLSEFNSAGTAITTSSGYTGGGLVDPSEIAVDGDGNVWITNPTGNCLSKFKNSGSAISSSSGFTAGGLGTLGGLGIDGSGNLWVAVTSTNTVAELVGVAAPVVTPLAAASVGGHIAQRP
jgi:hypothetical protein